jgi:hypothetical protein
VLLVLMPVLVLLVLATKHCCCLPPWLTPPPPCTASATAGQETWQRLPSLTPKGPGCSTSTTSCTACSTDLHA